LIKTKGERKAVVEMRKFLAGYTKDLKGARRFREKIMKIEDVQILKEMFYNFIKEV
jgi:tRNA-dihydrouridine synthase